MDDADEIFRKEIQRRKELQDSQDRMLAREAATAFYTTLLPVSLKDFTFCTLSVPYQEAWVEAAKVIRQALETR